MAMAFADGGAAVDAAHLAVGAERGGIGAEAHRAAFVGVFAADLLYAALLPLGHQTDERIGTGAEFGRAGALDADEIACRLDDRHLHAEADAEIRHMAFACKTRRVDLAFRAAFAEAPRHEDAVDVFEMRDGVLVFEDFGLKPFDVDADIVGDAAVGQRLGQRLIGVVQAGIFANDGNGDLAFRRHDAAHDFLPTVELERRRRDVEMAQHLAVEALLVIGQRHLIDCFDVERRHDRLGAHVAEQGNLAPLGIGDRPIGAAEQQVGLDADAL